MNSLSQKFMLGVIGSVIAACTVVGAENLIKTGDAENAGAVKKWHKGLTRNNQDKNGGENSFQGNSINIWAYSPEMVEIDPAKTYKLSGSFKSVGKDIGRCYLGLVMYDAKKRTITRPAITVKKGSITKLMADAKAGDKVLKLTDGSKWNAKNLSRTLIAFNAKEDFSDIPNFDLSSTIAKFEKKDDFYEVTLKTPLKKNYPAGTEVRQHYTGGGYQYCAAAYKPVPAKWTEYTANVKGIAKYGAPNKQFWPGAKFARVIVILNYRAKKDSDCQTLFDDISLTPLEENK